MMIGHKGLPRSSTHLPCAGHHGDLELAVPIDDLPAPRDARDALGHDVLARRLGPPAAHGNCVPVSTLRECEVTTNERLNGRGKENADVVTFEWFIVV